MSLDQKKNILIYLGAKMPQAPKLSPVKLVRNLRRLKVLG